MVWGKVNEFLVWVSDFANFRFQNYRKYQFDGTNAALRAPDDGRENSSVGQALSFKSINYPNSKHSTALLCNYSYHSFAMLHFC